MKVRWAVVLYTTIITILLVLFLSSCSDLPTMKYCDKVTYERNGSHAHMEMDCQLPVGGALPTP